MQLPEPALTLTLPSIHDGTALACRVYHPLGSSPTTTTTSLSPTSATAAATAERWRPGNAAVVAHPYAPLGGSYEDFLVEEVASLLVQKGFVVATFNFRGAGNSGGKTSWSSRPERDDYATVAGFLAYYVHHLDMPDSSNSSNSNSNSGSSSSSSHGVRSANAEKPRLLLLAGYSYGAMITSQLPPLPAMLAPFASAPPASTSNAGQVRHAAESLAAQQRGLARGRAARGGLRVGEAGGSSPRKSQDGGNGGKRRSFSVEEAEEKLRKGVHDLIHKTRHHPKHHQQRDRSPRERSRSRPGLDPGGAEDTATKPDGAPRSPPPPPPGDLVVPRAAYVLVSPLQGLVSNLATMSRSPWGDDPAAEAKLGRCPTLAVFGDHDVFVSAAKLRSWVARMERAGGGGSPASAFRGLEVEGAGHFWVEEGVLGRMMDGVGEFVDGLL
ncbi:hypothetical protein N3K66_008466 [Trichothecium roseum]|uniref:Uncharacterized protein n=1 Tax=Trichothecium roseum TaxID=47278 RepID=A0ACC0US05_9HYPO|nr:hypothetical protein N3K66_008466 [Trichothecium roseum]